MQRQEAAPVPERPPSSALAVSCWARVCQNYWIFSSLARCAYLMSIGAAHAGSDLYVFPVCTLIAAEDAISTPEGGCLGTFAAQPCQAWETTGMLGWYALLSPPSASVSSLVAVRTGRVHRHLCRAGVISICFR